MLMRCARLPPIDILSATNVCSVVSTRRRCTGRGTLVEQLYVFLREYLWHGPQMGVGASDRNQQHASFRMMGHDPATMYQSRHQLFWIIEKRKQRPGLSTGVRQD